MVARYFFQCLIGYDFLNLFTYFLFKNLPVKGLIQFSLSHYHAPSKFGSIVDSLYSGLSAMVLTDDWCTPCIPLKIGVYQGDPLSVVIFNTVINTLVDTVKNKPELGYKISNTRYSINILQYADDTCLVGNSPAACQQLLNTTEQWLNWSGMKAKIPKCSATSFQGSTGHSINPQLTLSGQNIPFLGNNTIKFFGLPIHIPNTSVQFKIRIKEKLVSFLTIVDKIGVTRRQKLMIYKLGVCPRLNWPLTIFQFSSTWIERELEATTTRFLKKWSGLAKSANTSILYLPKREGGLELPSLLTLYKKLQVSRQARLMRAEENSKRVKFRPAVIVRNTMQEMPSCTRKGLTSAGRNAVVKQEITSRMSTVLNLPRQGGMIKSSKEGAAEIWAQTLNTIPENEWKFVLNAAHDTLPHNANLHLWGEKETPICPLCKKEKQTLLHVLNNCEVALNLRRYNERHDLVLAEISRTIILNLPQGFETTTDLGSEYSFPQYLAATDQRPDMVLWNDTTKSVTLLELTIPFDTLLEEAAKRKKVKYHELVSRIKGSGYETTFLTIEVESRGLPNISGFSQLRQIVGLSKTVTKSLMRETTRLAIIGSYKIWCSRNNINI